MPAVAFADAMPAWTAVVERDQFLMRRGARGAVVGTVVEPDATGAWLIDETDGDGRLALYVRTAVPLPLGERVVVSGAWTLDGQRWVWQGDAALPKGRGMTPRLPRGLRVGVGVAPSDVVPLAQAADEKPTWFFVIGKPVRVGDGWPISEKATDKTATGYLILPGERESFGGRDLRTADERWELQKNVRYWVRVSKVKTPKGVVRGGGELPRTLIAEDAPSIW